MMKSAKLGFFGVGIPGVSLLDRYIFIELLVPFLFGMGLFTSLGLSIGTLFDLIRKITESGLPLTIALQVLLLSMPQFIGLAFPMSILLASLMAYSRLSSDSELVALRSIGVSAYRIIIPSLILSLLVTGLSFVCNDYVTPNANSQAKLIMAKALKRERPAFIEDNIIYPEYGKVKNPDGGDRTVLTRLFYAEKFNGQKMEGLTILDRSQPGVNQILTAESAMWNLDNNSWDFYNGTVYLIAPDGSYRNIIRFQHQQLDLPRAPLDVAQRNRDPSEMSFRQAQEYLEIVKLSKNEQRIRKLEVRIQEKISIPFASFAFALIGSALGIRPQNTGKATSFGLCVALIFSYYLLSFISSSMGIWGILSPFVSAWLPNFLALGAGTVLLTQAAK